MEEQQQLELRMYFLVPYNISPIQQGIQAGHAALRYARAYSADNPQVWEFVDNYETWVILNGGTTNEERDFEGLCKGTLNQIADQLVENSVDISYFFEPDLNRALTAVCFLADERVFNKKDYPDFSDWLRNVRLSFEEISEPMKNNPNFWTFVKTNSEVLLEMFPDYYKEWVRLVGGVKNVYLRELLRDKKLA